MKKFSAFKITAYASLVLTLAGCASTNSIYRPFDTINGTGALVDMKQRAIVVNERMVTESAENASGTPTKYKQRVVCAEPSPDALSAYAAELAGNVDNPSNIGANFKMASREAAAFVGQRTSSIQILRDSMYRVCENYANGGMEAEHYELMMRRYQRLAVAMMAIEQLTHAASPPPVFLQTTSQLAEPRPLSEWRTEIEKTQEEIRKLEADTASNATNKAANDLKIADKKNAIKTMQELMASGGSMGGSATGNLAGANLNPKPPNPDIKIVAETVGTIVQNVLGTDDTGYLCFDTVRSGKANQKISSFCDGYIEYAAAADKIKMKYFEECQKLKGDQFFACMKQIDGGFKSQRSNYSTDFKVQLLSPTPLTQENKAKKAE